MNMLKTQNCTLEKVYVIVYELYVNFKSIWASGRICIFISIIPVNIIKIIKLLFTVISEWVWAIHFTLA